MDDRHREHIRKNINELIRKTNYKELISACEHKRLLSREMCSRIENQTDSDEEGKHKELFIKLTKRGPNAYDELIKILINLKFSQAAKILHATKHADDSQYISMHDPVTIKPRTTEGPLISTEKQRYLPEGCYPSKDKVDSKIILEPYLKKIELPQPLEVKKSRTILYDKKVPTYSMKSRHRGVLFMVNIIDFPKTNNKKRSGADVDGLYLLYLFQELGFTCFEYTNLTRDEFFEILDQLRSSEHLYQTESFVLVLMSHGEMTDDMHDRVEFYDGAVAKVNEIEDALSNAECLSLVNKPKVLVFPFCRGMAPDKGVENLEADGIFYGRPALMKTIATRSDMLVCYASVRGFQALRDTDLGSWYIQTFVKVLAEHAHDTHLEDMLKIIGDKMKLLRSAEGHLQTPAFYNHGFTKLMFFNPGVYEE